MTTTNNAGQTVEQFKETVAQLAARHLTDTDCQISFTTWSDQDKAEGLDRSFMPNITLERCGENRYHAQWECQEIVGTLDECADFMFFYSPVFDGVAVWS